MEVQQLPRGRHRLARDHVVASQRERLLRAMGAAVAERGYAKTSVAEVLRRARVSRETFYEQFANKEDCFLAAFDAAAATVAVEIRAGLDPPPGAQSPGDPPSGDLPVRETLARVLEGYLGTLAAEPELARTFLVEVYAAGPAALARRVEAQERFVDLVAEITGARDERQRFACESIVAAASSLVTQRVCAGETGELLELERPMRETAAMLLDAVGIAGD